MKVFLILFFASFIGKSQVDFNYYQHQICVGEMPDIFTFSLEEKVKAQEMLVLEDGDKKSARKEKSKFALNASYHLQELLLNGKILFGDDLTNYINSVGDQVIKNYTFEKNVDIEFFVVKSPYVNAFATNEGKIFVTVGLLSQLETEAQLAFILCHEISHFEKGHVLQTHLYNKKVDKNKNKLKRYSAGDALLKKSAYSQDKELEADSIGFEIFSVSDYGTASVIGVFDIMRLSHLPIDEIKFDAHNFENKNFKIHDDFLVDSVAEIKPIESVELSTHPSSELRAEKISKLLKENPKQGPHFLIGKNEFFEKRNIARFELTNILLEDGLYQAMLYNNYVLLQEFPNSYFLNYTNAKALYFISKYKLRGIADFSENKNTLLVDYEEIQGSAQSLYHMIEKIPDKNFALMTVSYIWGIYKKFSNDKRLLNLATNIFNEVLIKEKVESSFFHKESLKSLTTNKNQDIKGYSTYTSKKEYLEADETFKLVFSDYFSDPEFENFFNARYEYAKDWKSYGKLTKKEKRKKEKSKVWNAKKDAKLGIDKLLFVDPIHVFFNTDKEEVLRIEKTTTNQRKLSENIDSIAKLLNLDLVMMDSKKLNKYDTDKFNDLVVLNNMVKERFFHARLDSLILDKNESLGRIAAEYGTTKLACNVMLTVGFMDGLKRIYKETPSLILFPIFFYPFAPLIMYDALTPDFLTYNYFYVFDIKTGDLELFRKYKMKGKPNRTLIKSHIYHVLSQVKKSK